MSPIRIAVAATLLLALILIGAVQFLLQPPATISNPISSAICRSNTGWYWAGILPLGLICVGAVIAWGWHERAAVLRAQITLRHSPNSISGRR